MSFLRLENRFSPLFSMHDYAQKWHENDMQGTALWKIWTWYLSRRGEGNNESSIRTGISPDGIKTLRNISQVICLLDNLAGQLPVPPKIWREHFMSCLQQLHSLQIDSGDACKFNISNVKNTEVFYNILKIRDYLNLGYILHDVKVEIFQTNNEVISVLSCRK